MVRHQRNPGVYPFAFIAACAACTAEEIPGAPEYEPGHHLAPVHLSHVAELEARGWTVVHDMYGDQGTTDCVCPHLAPALD